MSTVLLAPNRITKRQAAKRLGVPVPVVNRLIKEGQLKTARLANARAIVMEASVDQLIARMADDDLQTA